MASPRLKTTPPAQTTPLSDNQPARAALAALTILISALLAIPAFTGSDDFPVSSQPMFAAPREATAEFVTARGIDIHGDLVELSINEIAQTDDPLVAEVVLRDAEQLDALTSTCRQIAGRVDQPLVSVEIVRIRLNLDDGIGASSATNIEVLEQCQAS